MTATKFRCEDGKTINVQIIKNNGQLVVDPAQTRASYPYRVLNGDEHLDGAPPWYKRVEIIRCCDKYAEVKIVGPNLNRLIS